MRYHAMALVMIAMMVPAPPAALVADEAIPALAPVPAKRGDAGLGRSLRGQYFWISPGPARIGFAAAAVAAMVAGRAKCRGKPRPADDDLA